MRLVFFGTSGFAVPVLRKLHSAGHVIDPVVTAPALPQGRGHKLLPSPVAAAAGELGLAVLEPADPNGPEFVNRLAEARPDLAVLVAYGAVISPALLAISRLGFVNLHPSLLPEYRGAAPIQRALMEGRTRTGVTVIAMNEKVDAGDVLAQTAVNIGPDETAGELSDRLSGIGADLMADTLARLAPGEVERRTQDPARVTRARKILKSDRGIAWNRRAPEIHNHVRALSPEPGAVTLFRGRQLIVLRTKVSGGAGRPGEVLAGLAGFVVAAAQGAVELLEVRPEGGRNQPGSAFRNGRRLKTGEIMGAET